MSICHLLKTNNIIYIMITIPMIIIIIIIVVVVVDVVVDRSSAHGYG